MEEIDTNSYLEYVALLKKNNRKSLSDLGFGPIRYPWNRSGKVGGLRAITPSSKSYDSLIGDLTATRTYPKGTGALKGTDTSSPTKLTNDHANKYTWNLEGHKVEGTKYVPYVASDHKHATKNDSTLMSTGPMIGSTCTFQGRIIEKTEKFIKEHLEEISEERKLVRTWTPAHYPSSTFALKKDEPVLPSKAIQNWPEYSSLTNGEVIVTIEYCSDCDSHKLHTHHKAEHYLQMFSILRKPVVIVAELNDPGVAHTNEKSTFHVHQAKSDVVATVTTGLRIGAFEIQIAAKNHGSHFVHLIHSKLYRGEWPKKKWIRARMYKILTRVGKFAKRNGKSQEPQEEPQPRNGLGDHSKHESNSAVEARKDAATVPKQSSGTTSLHSSSAVGKIRPKGDNKDTSASPVSSSSQIPPILKSSQDITRAGDSKSHDVTKPKSPVHTISESQASSNVNGESIAASPKLLKERSSPVLVAAPNKSLEKQQQSKQSMGSNSVSFDMDANTLSGQLNSHNPEHILSEIDPALLSPSNELNTNSLLDVAGGDFADLILEGSLMSVKSGDSLRNAPSHSSNDSSDGDQYAKFLVSAQSELARKESVIAGVRAAPIPGDNSRIGSLEPSKLVENNDEITDDLFKSIMQEIEESL